MEQVGSLQSSQQQITEPIPQSVWSTIPSHHIYLRFNNRSIFWPKPGSLECEIL